jgi:hypothetical protein
MKFPADGSFDNRVLRGLLRRRRTRHIIATQDTEVAKVDVPTIRPTSR